MHTPRTDGSAVRYLRREREGPASSGGGGDNETLGTLHGALFRGSAVPCLHCVPGLVGFLLAGSDDEVDAADDVRTRGEPGCCESSIVGPGEDIWSGSGPSTVMQYRCPQMPAQTLPTERVQVCDDSLL